MSEFINENPTVVQKNELPRRKEDDVELCFSGKGSDEAALQRRKALLKIDHCPQSQVLQESELLDRLLSKFTSPESEWDDSETATEESDEPADIIDAQEIYDLIAYISDPEHPLSLGQLSVVNLEDIEVRDSGNKDEMAEVIVYITPTITHCSLATLIGLGIRVRLDRALPQRFRVTILLKAGSHQSENQVNKQLNDKERVAAACENEQLLSVVSKMLSTCQ
ncbi:hypothetical protein HG536_0D03010 [Torulaspora globosa]|uniref:Uncharacterized protein n=1 Tax=Torulaspora globosa TaxID=48254 RepID=A0A7G3ZGZ3_9SACH|nr:uncharacterized protein HG536_0D03010 [Torulaspora globosa]QLL32779.1 hypothetical protein HG536_0D03010 [Torulaspora globosa]